MTVHSGRFGVLNGQSTVKNWSINDQSQNPKAVASNTRNGTLRRAGIRSWAGSFSSYGHSPVVMPNEFFDFQGYTAPDDDVSGSGQVYEGQAIVDSVNITWNWANGELLAHNTNFSGHMELTPGDGDFEDPSDPAVFSICGTKIEYDAGAGFVEWENVAQASLTITAATKSYVNSSTNCWTGRTAGPVDWTLAVTEQNTERLVALDVNAMLDLKLYVTATAHWRLKWGILENFSNIAVNRESGEIISRVANLAKNGIALNSDVGRIILPDGSIYWPTGATSSSP